MIDPTSKFTDSIKQKFKLANTKLTIKKGTNENLLRISDNKLKPIVERDNIKFLNYTLPLRKNLKNYTRVSSDSNESNHRIYLHMLIIRRMIERQI